MDALFVVCSSDPETCPPGPVSAWMTLCEARCAAMAWLRENGPCEIWRLSRDGDRSWVAEFDHPEVEL